MYYLVHVTRSRLHLESNPYEHGYNCRIFDTSADKIVLRNNEHRMDGRQTSPFWHFNPGMTS
jgi:hypothetical protein